MDSAASLARAATAASLELQAIPDSRVHRAGQGSLASLAIQAIVVLPDTQVSPAIQATTPVRRVTVVFRVTQATQVLREFPVIAATPAYRVTLGFRGYLDIRVTRGLVAIAATADRGYRDIQVSVVQESVGIRASVVEREAWELQATLAIQVSVVIVDFPGRLVTQVSAAQADILASRVFRAIQVIPGVESVGTLASVGVVALPARTS